MSANKTRKLVISAFLLALSILLSRFFSLKVPLFGVDLIRVGLGGFPIVLAGLLFGPLTGGLVGALADLAGFMIFPLGPYFPQFTLTSALNGILPPLLLLNKKPPFTLLRLFWAIGITRLLTHGFLVPYFLTRLFNLPPQLTFPPHLILQLFTVPLYVFFARLLLKVCRESLSLKKGEISCATSKP